MDAVAVRHELSSAQRLETERLVNEHNRVLNGDKIPNQVMGKDDFLKILLTQLTNQDPTKPMEDKEFIAQMAQFSSLEQMNNMSNSMQKLGSMIASGQAMGTLGRVVDISTGTETVSGRVEAVTGGDYPQVLVGGTYYDYGQIQSVRQGEITP